MKKDLDTKYLKETKGKLLVNEVRNIQPRLKNKAIVIGCLKTLTSYFFSLRSLYITATESKIRSGSVGISKPIPAITSSYLTENGTKKMVRKINLSNENTPTRTPISKAGSKSPTYNPSYSNTAFVSITNDMAIQNQILDLKTELDGRVCLSIFQLDRFIYFFENNHE